MWLRMLAASIALGPGRVVASVDATPFAPYLPDAVRAEAVQALSAVDHSEAALRALPSVQFESAESSTLSKEPVVNRIHLMPGARFDLWLMRQRQGGKDGWDPSRWSYVAIVVDKRPADAGVPEAYYLEFAPEPVASGALPRPIAPRVACYRCHANGPRAVRPMPSTIVPTLSREALARIAAWNASVAEAGVMRNHLTEAGDAAKVYKSKAAMVTVTTPKCRQCHDPVSGIRAELRRLHAGSISFLATHGDRGDGLYGPVAGAPEILPAYNAFLRGMAPRPAMPIEEEPLDDAEAACLTSFLKNSGQPASCAVAAKPPAPTQRKVPPPHADGATWVLDSAASRLQARVITSVSQIEVGGLALSGKIACPRSEACVATVDVNLAAATTGLPLRDRHLRQRLLVDRHADALGRSEPFAWPENGAGATTIALPLTLSVAGISAPARIELNCSAPAAKRVHCAVGRFDWDMRAHGVEPPAFLGLRVQPVVKMSGDLVVFRAEEK